MINQVMGNMFYGQEQTLVCPVNMVGTMGNGLALYFKKRWPNILPVYGNACRNRTFLKNQLVVVPIGNGKQVLLFPTKNHWRDDSPIELIERFLDVLAKDYQKLGITSLAMPKIGCGKGNLDFTEVDEVIRRVLGSLDIPITIYV